MQLLLMHWLVEGRAHLNPDNAVAVDTVAGGGAGAGLTLPRDADALPAPVVVIYQVGHEEALVAVHDIHSNTPAVHAHLSGARFLVDSRGRECLECARLLCS